jgi:hypothetical protein
MTRNLVLLIAFAGCHHDDATKADGGVDVTCDGTCIPGWWSVTTGGCSAFCSLAPKPRECQASDCQQVVVYDIMGADQYADFQALLSAGDRTFTLFTKQTGMWLLPSPCNLSLNTQTDPSGSEFSCSGTTLTLPTRSWTRLDASMQSAVEATAAMTLPAQGSY